MMKCLQLAVLSSVALTLIAAHRPTVAATFDHQEVEQSQFIAVAAPYGDNLYELLVIEQIPGKQQCWSESGSKPITVEPLLLNFDFTGSCGRSTDSNGYSIRLDSQDYGMDYLLRVVKRNDELLLVGTHRSDRRQPEIVVGRTYGIANGLLKIFLDPGWRFTKRSYQGKVLGHVYFSASHSALATPDSLQAEKPDSDTSSTSGVLSTENPSSGSGALSFEFSAPSFTRLPSSLSRPTTATPGESAPSLPPATSAGGMTIAAPSPDNSALPSNPADRPLLRLPVQSPSSPTSASAMVEAPISSNTPLPPPPEPGIPYRSPGEEPALGTDAVSSPSSLPAERRSLSDLMVVAPNASPSTGASERLPVPNTPIPQSSTPIAAAEKYKVIVTASGSNQQQQVRSLYPDAFSTVHQGESGIQVGVFSSRDRAERTLQDLRNYGLNGVIVPL